MRLLLEKDWNYSVHQENGLSIDQENQCRINAINFMIFYGQIIHLSEDAFVNAFHIFHIYSFLKPFNKFDRFTYGAASIFLGSKLKDEPKSLQDSVKKYIFAIQKFKKDEKWDISQFDTKLLDEFFKNQNEEQKIKIVTNDMQQAEYELLKSCGFDLDIDSPYKYLNLFFDKNKDLKYMQKFAKNFLNDSYRLNICLFYEPIILALTAVYNTSLILKVEIDETRISEFVDGINFKILQEVSQKIQTYYK